MKKFRMVFFVLFALLLSTHSVWSRGQARQANDANVGYEIPEPRKMPALGKGVESYEPNPVRSTRAFVPDHNPDQAEITSLGGQEGGLAPLFDSDADALVKEHNEAMQDGADGEQTEDLQLQIQRRLESNLAFAKTMNLWNSGNGKEAAKKFRAFFEEYPESPWAGEALLHIADEAGIGGRLAEAQEIYDYILQNTGGKFGEDDYEIHQKAKQAWTVLDIAIGNNQAASEKLGNILKTEQYWRRVTWAQTWLHEVALRGGSRKRQELACGTQALGILLVKAGKTKSAARLENLNAPRQSGWSLAELQTLASREGLTMETFVARRTNGLPDVSSLQSLRPPFLIQCSASPSATNSNALLQARPAWRNLQKRSAGLAEAFRPSAFGHFWVVLDIDAKDQTVSLLNPSNNTSSQMTWEQLAREWTGKGLATKSAVSNSRLAVLPKASAMRSYGTGWVDKPGGGKGNHPSNGKVKGICSNGEPTIAVNQISMNTYIEDTPLWHNNPYGPDVQFTMSYNSQSSAVPSKHFRGNWTMNYETRAVEAANGDATVYMPDGKEELYTLATQNGSYCTYTSEVGNFKNLIRDYDSGSLRFVLTFTDESKYFYRKENLSSSIYDLKRIEHGLGGSLTLIYKDWQVSSNPNDKVRCLDYVVDWRGRRTVFEYFGGSPLLYSVTDHWGRASYITYTTNAGNDVLTCADMGNNSYSYEISPTKKIVKITTSRGAWKIKDEPTDSQGETPPYTSEYMYPPPNGRMYRNWRVTITDPDNFPEEFYFCSKHFSVSDGRYRTWYVDKNNYVPNTPGNNNLSNSVQKTSFIPDLKLGNEWYISERWNPEDDGNSANNISTYGYDGDDGVETYGYDGFVARVNSYMSARENNEAVKNPVILTYNGKGRVTTVTNERGFTKTFIYASNDLDVIEVKNEYSNTVMTAKYSSSSPRLPYEVTDHRGYVTKLAYSGKQIFSVTEAFGTPEQRTTTYNRDGVTRLLQNVKRTVPGGEVNLGTFTFYDSNLLHTSTDARGNTTTYNYTLLDQVGKIIYPNGTNIDPEWCNCGLLNSVKDRGGRTTYYTYDNLKRLKKTTDAEGRMVQMTYDAVGNAKTLTDERNKITQWQYDDMARVLRKTLPDTTYLTFSYDRNGNVKSDYNNARNLSATYTYDDADNLLQVQRAGIGADVTFTYNAMDLADTMSDSSGTTTFGYDSAGVLKSESGSYDDSVVERDYDAIGRRKILNVRKFYGVPSIETINYSWDTLDRLKNLSAPSGTFAYSYEGNSGLLDKIAYPNGSASLFDWDTFNRMSGTSVGMQNGSTFSFIAAYTQSLDAREVMNSLSASFPATFGRPAETQVIDYTYDNTNRLQRETSREWPPALDTQYNYDAAGNRGTITRNGGGNLFTISHSPDSADNTYNQISTSGPGISANQTLTYDGGNLEKVVNDNYLNGTTYTDSYEFDAADRLSSWTRTNGPGYGTNVSRTEWTYDGFNRARQVREMLWQNNAWQTQSTRLLIYDGMAVVQERLIDNYGIYIVASNVWGLDISQSLGGAGNIGGLLSRTTYDNGVVKKRYAHHDGRGNIIALTKDGTGMTAAQAVVARYRYDAYGVILLMDGGAEAESNPYRYQSKRRHSGTSFYDFGFRFYSPHQGRFINRDPIGEAGGINLYGYVQNNPVNQVDPYGLARVEVHWRRVTWIGDQRTWGSHSFVLVWDTDSKGRNIGTPYIFAGYNHDPSGKDDGLLHRYYGKFDSRCDDYTYVDKTSKYNDPYFYHGTGYTLYDPNKPASAFIRRFKTVADAIERKKIPYQTLYRNSNSFVTTLFDEGLGSLGGAPMLTAPGWQINLITDKNVTVR